MRISRSAAVVFFVILLASCASTQSVDMKEPRRVVGTESDVRLDAEVHGETLTFAQTIVLQYDITNQRPLAIAVADIQPETTYDSDTQTVTIAIGSEVPGERLLPRLIIIGSGEKKSFSAAAHVNINLPVTAPNPFQRYPRALRIKLNFLGETKPFEKLISIAERSVYDPKMAAELFPRWVEQNETVYTNAIPMHWAGLIQEEPQPTVGRRRRGGT